jgi:hypothetical protein
LISSTPVNYRKYWLVGKGHCVVIKYANVVAPGLNAACAVALSDQARRRSSWRRSKDAPPSTLPYFQVQRAKMILLAADGFTY